MIENNDDAVKEFMSLLADGKIDYISVREKMRLSPFAVNDPSGEIEKMIED